MADITYESHYRPRWFHPRLRWLVIKGLIWRMLVLAFLAWLAAAAVFPDALHLLTGAAPSAEDWIFATLIPAYPEFLSLALCDVFGGNTQDTVVALLLFHGRLLLLALVWLHQRKKRIRVILGLMAFVTVQAGLYIASRIVISALAF